jgi:hypothetical protein
MTLLRILPASHDPVGEFSAGADVSQDARLIFQHDRPEIRQPRPLPSAVLGHGFPMK